MPDPCTYNLDLCDQHSGKGFCKRVDSFVDSGQPNSRIRNIKDVIHKCECQTDIFHFQENGFAKAGYYQFDESRLSCVLVEVNIEASA